MSIDKIAFTAADLNSLVQASAPNIPGNLGGIIFELMRYVFPAAGIALLLYLIFGGYQVMLSGGDPKSVAAGRSKITNAIIGFVIVFAAYWIAIAVGEILGLRTVSIGVF